MEIVFGDVGAGKTRFMLREAIKAIKQGGSVEYWNMGDNINLSDLAYANQLYRATTDSESWTLESDGSLNASKINRLNINLSDYQCLYNIVKDWSHYSPNLCIIDGFYPSLFKPTILNHSEFIADLNNLFIDLNIKSRILYSWSDWEFEKEFFGFLAPLGVTHVHHILGVNSKTYEIGVDIKIPGFRVWSPGL